MAPHPPTAAQLRAAVAERPRLRGVLHLAMAPIAAVMAIALVWQASGAARVTTTVFGLALVGLYTISGSYHIARWKGRVRVMWGRVDTAMIVLFIAGTFTPIGFHALDGHWRLWSLLVAWVVAVVGAGIAISPITAPRWVRTAGYLAIGWLMIVPLWKVAASLPLAGTALIVLGGVLYTVGGVVYAMERPNPAPRWFGFHEVFHLLVIAASVCHYTAILRYVI